MTRETPGTTLEAMDLETELRKAADRCETLAHKSPYPHGSIATREQFEFAARLRLRAAAIRNALNAMDNDLGPTWRRLEALRLACGPGLTPGYWR